MKEKFVRSEIVSSILTLDKACILRFALD